MISIFVLSIVCGVALGAVALSWAILWRAQTLVRAAQQCADHARQENQAALEAIRERVEGLYGQLGSLSWQAASGSHAVRPGLNLNKRFQALRMYRRGDTPEQISAALEIPLQELDLLVKVHRIVMSSL
jgi:hypothetical protein